MEIKTIKLAELPDFLEIYLKILEEGVKNDKIGKTTAPVYYRDGDEVFLIEDYILHDVKTFETAPSELGIYSQNDYEIRDGRWQKTA